ncbi:Protein kinase domain-containing protein [Fusarium sp. Ph1]|nr:Protein kinase domain-containing protein [Fusarium sp. Ph1]
MDHIDGVRIAETAKAPRITFGAVYSTLTNTNDDRSFESQAFLRGLGARVSRRAISNEKDLEHFQHNSVEDPVRSIVQRLTEEETFCDEFDVGDGIIFENHPSAISDVAEEVVERQGSPVTPPRTPGPDQLDRSQLRPDQICVYTADEQSSLRNMAYVMEYKAPHKLTPVHMRASLHSMDIHKQVVNRATVPTADDQETYHYMIENGLEYGLLTTGETIVFLKIDWQKDPGTLYFHLAEHGPELRKERSPESSDDEPERPLPNTPTPAPRADSPGTRRSQRILARRPHGGGNNSNSNSGTGGAGAGEGSSGRSVRQYCSQKCLRGLMTRSPLDKGCPNVMPHREHDDGRQTHHPVDHGEWLQLLRNKLKRSLDEGMVPLGKEGSRGVLFQLTLLEYGYTFVSKGTVAAFIEDLEHEVAAYQHLHRLQGITVPVFIGAIDLRDLGSIFASVAR